MSEEEKKKLKNEEADSNRNLVGFFSILLDEARRIAPEKYLITDKTND
jgi:hypothetical protein